MSFIGLPDMKKQLDVFLFYLANNLGYQVLIVIDHKVSRPNLI